MVDGYNNVIQNTTNQKPYDLHFGNGQILNRVNNNIAKHSVKSANELVTENVAQHQPKDAFNKIQPGEWVRIVQRVGFDSKEKRDGSSVLVKKYKQVFSKEKYKVVSVLQSNETGLVKLQLSVPGTDEFKTVPFNSVIVVPEVDTKPVANNALGNREAALNKLQNMPVAANTIPLPPVNKVQLRNRQNVQAPARYRN